MAKQPNIMTTDLQKQIDTIFTATNSLLKAESDINSQQRGDIEEIIKGARKLRSSIQTLSGWKTGDPPALTQHKVRSPINIVVSFAAMLLEGYSGTLTPTTKQHIQTIYDAGQSILDWVDQAEDGMIADDKI